MWPESNAVVSKFYTCGLCGLSVHAECRDVALRCMPCSPGTAVHRKDKRILGKHWVNGRIVCQILQAYDLKISNGTYIYGLSKLPGGQETIQTKASAVNDGDCAWVSVSGPDEGPDRRSESSSTCDGESYFEWIASKDSFNAEGSSILMELWSSTLYGMFDSALMSVNINVLPLLMYPNVAIERWFTVYPTSTTETGVGMMLVRLAFLTDALITENEACAVKLHPIITSSVKDMTSKSCDYNVDKDQCQAPSQIIVPDQNLNIEASEKLSLQKAQFDQAASSRGLEEADLKTQQSLNTNDTNHSYIHDVDDSNSANAPFKWSRSTITQSVKDLSATISTLVWEEYRSPRNKKLKGSELKLGQQGANDVSVGKLTVHLIDAYRTDVKDAADGDYFATCAIVDSDGTVTHNSVLLEEDTHMIYSSAAPVFNCKFEFEVPHFRCAVRFWLIDGNSGRKVGTSFISVHAIIQRDIERMLASSAPFGNKIPFPYLWKDNQTQVRTLKDENIVPVRDYGLDGAIPTSKNEPETNIIALRDISELATIGHFSAVVQFKENIEELFLASNPRLAKVGPMESVSVDRLRVHIDRFKSLVDLFGALNREHKKIMDWEDPKYTVFLLVGFTSAILFIDAEYALSVPLFIVVVLMTKMWFYRSSGGFRKQLIEKDTDVDLAPYKPYAYIRVAVGDVKHIGSSNQFGGGHPCPQFTKITLIQPEVSLKTVEDSSTTSFEYSEHIIALVPMKHSLGKSIRPVSSGSAIGTGSGISQLLSNLNIIKSDAKKDGILQNVLDPWPRQQPSNSVDISYLYPILQTNISTDVKHRSSNEVDNSQGASSDDIPLNKSKFRQWAEIQGKIKFTFYGDSPEQSFVDSTLGSITVPLKDLLRDFDSVSSGGLQPEVSGWYPIKWNKNLLNNIKTMSSNDEVGDNNSSSKDNSNFEAVPNDIILEPLVFLRLQIDLREETAVPTEDDIEISRAIQSILAPDDEASSGAISTLWNMPENIKYVQNLMGSILNSIESFKNIFNWTLPLKTNLIYWVLVVFWVISVFVPGRYLLLFGGLYDFFYCFMPQPDDYPFDTRLHNLLEAVPNDDDLMRVYDEDRKRHIANVKENHKQMLKAAKLKIFFNCSWEGFVKIKDSVIDTTNGSRIGWHNAYIVLHGHRLVWWNSVEDINSGRAPVGQVLLFGHAGVSHASPLDIKEFGDDGRLLSVFGKDNASEQRKITLLCKSSSACQTLATAIQKLLQSYDSRAESSSLTVITVK